MDGYFISHAGVDAVTMFDGVDRRTLGTTDESMLCEFRLAQGAKVPLHHHMNDQVGYIVSGVLELTIGETTHQLRPGDSYAIPGGIEHHALATEDCVIIDCFSPPRSDYRTEAR